MFNGKYITENRPRLTQKGEFRELLDVVPSQSQINQVIQIYAGLLPEFNALHAVLYLSLVDAPKTAREVIKTCDTQQSRTYITLKQMVEWRVIQKTRTQPATYYIERPHAVLNHLISRQTRLLQQRKEQLRVMLQKEATSTQDLVLQIKEGCVKLYNKATNEIISDPTRIQEAIDALARHKKENTREKEWVRERMGSV